LAQIATNRRDLIAQGYRRETHFSGVESIRRNALALPWRQNRFLAADMARISRLLVLIGIAASSCADRYAIEAQRRTLEAQNVPPANYKPDLLAFMRTYLNNPQNVRNAAMSEPQKLMVIDLERYASCLRYNPKNNAGRYTGLRDHLAVFISGKFDRLIELSEAERGAGAGSEALRPLRNYCATASYQPFPELEQLRR
jgi:hypothetical protein